MTAAADPTHRRIVELHDETRKHLSIRAWERDTPRPASKPRQHPRVGVGLFLFWPWLHPKPDHQLREILHAGALHAFMVRRFFENRHHTAALLIVSPQLPVEPRRHRMIVVEQLHGRANFLLPKLSFVAMTLPIIEHTLLKPVQTHAANVRHVLPRTTAKPHPTAALHFSRRHY